MATPPKIGAEHAGNSSSLSQRSLANLSKVARKSAGTVGLPGLLELTGKIEDVIGALIYHEDRQKEFDLLVNRLQNALQILEGHPSSEREGITQTVSELERILRTAKSVLQRKTSIGSGRFEQHDELLRQATSQIEAFSLQHILKSIDLIEGIKEQQQNTDRQIQLLNGLVASSQSTRERDLASNEFYDKVPSVLYATSQLTEAHPVLPQLVSFRL
ncbi:hypothetical protein FRC09_000650 [Ceratobasidium sp. 395]|nr:hypothetical protein FRC09_000650 [Ceratobasidium sp. 395]